MGYSFTDLGAEGCRRSLNALLKIMFYLVLWGFISNIWVLFQGSALSQISNAYICITWPPLLHIECRCICWRVTYVMMFNFATNCNTGFLWKFYHHFVKWIWEISHGCLIVLAGFATIPQWWHKKADGIWFIWVCVRSLDHELISQSTTCKCHYAHTQWELWWQWVKMHNLVLNMQMCWIGNVATYWEKSVLGNSIMHHKLIILDYTEHNFAVWLTSAHSGYGDPLNMHISCPKHARHISLAHSAHTNKYRHCVS